MNGKQEIVPASGTAVAVRTSTSLAALDELDTILRTGELEYEIVDDPAEISRQIMDQLLSATSDEELFDFGNAVGWQELLGVPVEIRGFQWRPSEYVEEGGLAVYLVVRAIRMDEGTPVTLTTGSGSVVGMLSNLARRGRIPGVIVRLVRADKPTKSGFRPMFLELAGDGEAA